ncbi:hypothetical protein WS86_22755 [Burkholderia savannae]|nr:hypothetical protein WS86_22755 [Burkholderia savannae]
MRRRRATTPIDAAVKGRAHSFDALWPATRFVGAARAVTAKIAKPRVGRSAKRRRPRTSTASREPGPAASGPRAAGSRLAGRASARIDLI